MSSDRVTQLLADVKNGSELASSELLALVYDDLRGLARGMVHRGPGVASHTLQPTALVNEACLRLLGQSNLSLQSRAHLFAVAAMAMRQVLSNHARAKRADKRTPEGDRVTLAAVSGTTSEVDLLALDDALTKLEALDARQARLVALRFFAGMTMDDAATVLGISLSSAEREWRAARAFLWSELGVEGRTGGA